MTRPPRPIATAVCAALAPLATAAPRAGAGETSPPDSDCFWLGPISTKKRAAGAERFDGRNFNFPEESATYWLARYRLQSGQRLVLRGRYPHARYESLNSYAQGGTPTHSLPDTSIRPDSGSTNPFATGARRDRSRRNWTVNVLDQAPPEGGGARNTLYAPSTDSFPSEILLRVYDPDRSIDRTVQRIPASAWQNLVNTPGPTADPATSPAFDPPQWERFFAQGFASGAFQQHAGNPRPEGGQSDAGGFYSNRDARYILTHLSRRHGKVLVIRGRMPRFPETYGGARRMPAAQLRFWSLCSAESRVTTRTPDCLADRQVPLEEDRDYTIVVSRRADRPRNARPACGIAWLDWGNRGDAAGRPDYGLLIMRNMLASAGFRQSIQRIQRFGDETTVMRAYFPRSEYSSKRAVERIGC